MQIGSVSPAQSSRHVNIHARPLLSLPVQCIYVHLKQHLKWNPLFARKEVPNLFSLLLKATNRFITESDEAKREHTGDVFSFSVFLLVQSIPKKEIMRHRRSKYRNIFIQDDWTECTFWFDFRHFPRFPLSPIWFHINPLMLPLQTPEDKHSDCCSSFFPEPLTDRVFSRLSVRISFSPNSVNQECLHLLALCVE